MPTDPIVELLNEIEPPKVRPLFNTATKCYQYTREQPKHRVMIELAAKGFDKKEIAQMSGVTPPTVHNVLNSPIFQGTIAETIRRRVGQDDEVVELVNEGARLGLQTMLNILRNKEGRTSDHISAAKEFLDRKYGKSVQPIVKSEVDFNTLSIAEVAAQLPQTEGTGNTIASEAVGMPSPR